MQFSPDHLWTAAVHRTDLLLLACAALAAAVATAPPLDHAMRRTDAVALWSPAPSPSDQFAVTDLEPAQSTLKP